MSRRYEYHSQTEKKAGNRGIPYLILVLLAVIIVVYMKCDGTWQMDTAEQKDRNRYDFGLLKAITYPVENYIKSQVTAESYQERMMNLLMENTPLYGYSIESSSKEYGLLQRSGLICENEGMTELCMENEREGNIEDGDNTRRNQENYTENEGSTRGNEGSTGRNQGNNTGNQGNNTGNEGNNTGNVGNNIELAECSMESEENDIESRDIGMEYGENNIDTPKHYVAENSVDMLKYMGHENSAAMPKYLAAENNADSAFLIQNVIFENIGMDSPPDIAVFSDDIKTDSMLSVSTRTNTSHMDSYFRPAVKKAQEYSMKKLSDQDYLLKTFYAVDSGTTAPLDKLDAQRLLSEDMSVDKTTDGPQILIYHTHSQEGFADSVPGDDSTTILGAGEELTRILEEDYGYKVLHHTGQYDTKEHDYAYSYALPEISKILEDNPSIQVVIDLHRDEMQEGKKLLTECGGKPAAQIMFFNGLSYVNSTGAISYLENKNLSSNLAFSFQMQKAANEYYPGFARKIYLKGYRYNMHLSEKYLLIELGAQTNTVEEIKNACYPLADILDKVIGD